MGQSTVWCLGQGSSCPGLRVLVPLYCFIFEVKDYGREKVSGHAVVFFSSRKWAVLGMNRNTLELKVMPFLRKYRRVFKLLNHLGP